MFVDLAAIEKWLEDYEKIISLASYVVGLCGVLTGFGTLIYNVRNNTRTRNFNNVLALQKLIREEKEKFHAVAAIRPRDQTKYKLAATHYFNVLEMTAFSLNHKFISGRSSQYLADWVRDELDGIYQSETQGAVMNELRQTDDPPFGEIFRFHGPRKPLPLILSGLPRYERSNGDI
ncbi:hypothetical protein HFO72_12900 [Rhizobium laguerreae]|uniref:hypothetical protein n=1 Tax=Rhizobium laguerreae TaxID=1076926 RepID=UPI001C907670|nr:hypothetical protein [Rhizobium laguerreae]MBY3091696.1 hypothetical protein [Rhizobium laguerreae]